MITKRGAASIAGILLLMSSFGAPEVSAQASLPNSISEDTPTMYAQFTRVFENPATRDSIAGEFYYIQPDRLYLEIDFPVNQVVVIDNLRNLTMVYYPDQQRGFEFQGARPAAMPVISGILAALQPDYGLGMLGFEIHDQEIQGDTLLTYWRHPQDDGTLGEFILTRTDDRLVSVLLTFPTTNGAATTRFPRFVTHDGHVVPVEIATEIRNFLGTASELLVFENVEINPDIPADVMDFQIPAGVAIERRQW